MSRQNKVCVVGASGLVGSSIVRCALEKGYTINGTVTNLNVPKKIKYIKALPGAERLDLFTAHSENEEDFYEPLEDTNAVFIACLIPIYKGSDGTPSQEMDDVRGYKEIIMPTVNGCLNILKASYKKGIRNVLICSSTSSTNPSIAVRIKNENDHWSDEKDQCKQKKYTSAAKTVMEKTALQFCHKYGIRLNILLPTGLYGDAILPEHMNHNPFVWLKRVIEGGVPRHEITPNNSVSMIHLRDLASLFIAAYEKQSSSGRYFGVYDSLHWKDIYHECQKLIPKMIMPKPLTEIPVSPTRFDFSRRNSLGVAIRDFPRILRETVDWIKSDPFNN